MITDLGAGIASDINERGEVVGGGAFIWQDGKKTQLGTLGGPSSSAARINDQGQAIGGSLTGKPVKGHAFIWRDGTMTDLGTLGGDVRVPSAINEHDEIVGGSNSASGKGRGVLWTLKRGT